MLNQTLSQKMLQRLSPQQIQLMKLLQVPTVQLEQRIKEELETNPALEEGESIEEESNEESPIEDEQPAPEEKEESEESPKEEEPDFAEYLNDDEVPDYKLRDNNYPDPDEAKTIPIAVERSFHEYLFDQVRMFDLDETQEKIAMQIIGNMDDDGYLRREPGSIADDLSFGEGIQATDESILAVLKKIQEMDPPGIGARDLKESLLLQLNKLDEQNERVELAKIIIRDHFEAFSKKHYEKLLQNLNITEKQLKSSVDIIVHLNPKPGIAYSPGSNSVQHIYPDYFLTNNNGELQLTLNGANVPELRVSQQFREMVQEYTRNKNKTRQQKEAVMFIKQKIDGAKWFIDAIQLRQKTLVSTMQAIMQYQYEFFNTGDLTNLKPMILKDIAEKIGLDISTISRVGSSKYVQTEFGVFPLKYFFSESIYTDAGEEVSTREVKQMVSELVNEENKKKPCSDHHLTVMLKEKGYNIARRTVAKYRDQLNIPVARLRKQLFPTASP